jgi:Ca2+-binding EF-hand superfamily protein
MRTTRRSLDDLKRSGCALAIALGLLVAAEAHGQDAGQGVPKVFGVLDSDGDGAIDEPEFENNKVRAMMLFDRNEDASLERDEVRLSDAAFAEADSDGDGIISGVEFVEAPFGQFTTIDADHDGQVTPQELADFAKTLRQAGASSSAM